MGGSLYGMAYFRNVFMRNHLISIARRSEVRIGKTAVLLTVLLKDDVESYGKDQAKDNTDNDARPNEEFNMDFTGLVGKDSTIITDG